MMKMGSEEEVKREEGISEEVQCSTVQYRAVPISSHTCLAVSQSCLNVR